MASPQPLQALGAAQGEQALPLVAVDGTGGVGRAVGHAAEAAFGGVGVVEVLEALGCDLAAIRCGGDGGWLGETPMAPSLWSALSSPPHGLTCCIELVRGLGDRHFGGVEAEDAWEGEGEAVWKSPRPQGSPGPQPCPQRPQLCPRPRPEWIPRASAMSRRPQRHPQGPKPVPGAQKPCPQGLGPKCSPGPQPYPWKTPTMPPRPRPEVVPRAPTPSQRAPTLSRRALPCAWGSNPVTEGSNPIMGHPNSSWRTQACPWSSQPCP